MRPMNLYIVCVGVLACMVTVSSRGINREGRLIKGQAQRNARSLQRSFGASAMMGPPRGLNHMLKQPILSFGTWFGGGRSKRAHFTRFPIDKQIINKASAAQAIDASIKKNIFNDDVNVLIGQKRPVLMPFRPNYMFNF